MQEKSRRELLAMSLGGAVWSSCGSAPEPESEVETPVVAKFDHDLGAQLYTLRSVIADDPAGILKSLAAIGYVEAEVLQSNYAKYRPMILDAGLAPKAMHLSSELITSGAANDEDGKPLSLDGAIEQAAADKIAYLVMPYLREEDRGTDLDHYKALAEKLSAAGEKCAAAGIGFAYHNHAFEFEPMGDATPLAALVDGTDPGLMKLELDVFWVSVAGADPAALIAEQADRVRLVHLKDKAPDYPQQYKEGAPPEAFREVGSGSINFPAVLRACTAAGVEHYVVEQDQTPGDPIDSLRQSYDYLRSVEI